MINWLKRLFVPDMPHVEYLAKDYCNGKSDQELVNKLKGGMISLHSGHMIVTELLDRIINKRES